MILTCPACATSYFVPDEAIGANGRRVRCKSCGHDWRATLDEEPLELSPVSAGASAEAAEEVPGIFQETPAPELPRAFREKAEQRRRMKRAAAQGAVWAGLAVGLIALLVAAFVFRLPIVKSWPQVAAVYKALGIDVNLTGLDFEATRGRTAPHDPSKVVVSGALRNLRDNEVVAPPVRIALLDAQGFEVAHSLLRIEAAPVLPGKVLGFAAVLSNTDGKGTSVAADLVVENDARETKVVAGTGKARPSRHPPQAEEEGLRREEAVELSPIEARPLDSNGD